MLDGALVPGGVKMKVEVQRGGKISVRLFQNFEATAFKMYAATYVAPDTGLVSTNV